ERLVEDDHRVGGRIKRLSLQMSALQLRHRQNDEEEARGRKLNADQNACDALRPAARTAWPQPGHPPQTGQEESRVSAGGKRHEDDERDENAQRLNALRQEIEETNSSLLPHGRDGERQRQQSKQGRQERQKAGFDPGLKHDLRSARAQRSAQTD